MDELAFNNASANASAAGRIRRNATDLTYHNSVAARTLMPGYVLLAAGTSSNVATVDFTSTVITTAFDRYKLFLTAIVPATDNTDLWMRFSQSAAFLSGAADYTHTREQSTGAGLTEITSAGDTKIMILNALGNAAGEAGHVEIDLMNLTHASLMKRSWYHMGWTTATPTVAMGFGSGTFILNNTAVDGVRIMMSSGNISCEYALFGIRKAI